MTKRRLGTMMRVLAAATSLTAGHVALAAMGTDETVPPPASTEAIGAPQPTLIPAVAIAPTAEQTPAVAADQPDPRQVECVAKVIIHEAANQPERGQIAVAQVIRARIRDGRFGADACGVVKQRGQFFDVDAYRPSRTDARWQQASRIAADTLRGAGEDVAAGALFFHSGGRMGTGRVQIAQIADHVFYR